MINVLLADDHFLLREGLKHLLNSLDDIHVIAEAENGTDTLNIISKMSDEINVAIIDITMPGHDALEIITKISKEFPSIPIIVLTGHDEELYAVRALQAGASSYLTKQHKPETIISAIRKVSSGGKYISEKTADILASKINNKPDNTLHSQLSNREFTVLNMIAEGASLNEIALKLNLSNRTINTYKQRLLKKMNMTSSAQIVRYAIEHKLIQ